MHAGLSILYVLLFLVILRKWRFMQLPGMPSYVIPSTFLLKVMVGLALWALYTWHYTLRDTSDAFRYFDDAMLLRSLLFEDPATFFKLFFGYGLEDPALAPLLDKFRAWNTSYSYGLSNDNRTVIRLHTLIGFFSFGYYHVHTVFSCFLAIIGSAGLYRFFQRNYHGNSWLLFLGCFLLPSLLFWSSGVLKEPILLLGLGLLLYSLTKALDGKRLHWLVILPSVFLLIHIKPYVFFTHVPALLTWLLIRITRMKGWLSFSLVHGAGLILLFVPGIVYDGNTVPELLEKKRRDFYNVAEMQQAGSVIELPESQDGLSFIGSVPEALTIAYFRPWLWEGEGALYRISGMENSLYLLLALLSIGFLLVHRLPWNSEDWFSLSAVLVLGMVIGTTVPILGAVMRYKIPVLPMLWFLCLPVMNTILNRLRAGKVHAPRE